jgi:aryl-alcohol dehydrogenase-like predicted oxidoreductase
MEQRRLGTQGPTVSALGLGCMGMSQSYGPADEDESIATLHRALDLGITFFDTANAYGLGHNERLIGPVLRTRRDAVVIATKFGIAGRSGGKMVVDGRPEAARKCCDESLERLGVDTIDLYYLHRVDKTVPIEDTVGAMAELVVEGKVRHLGLSEASAATIRRAHAVHPIAAVQSEYSLWTRDLEDEILPTLDELGIALVAYSPLGRGFLAGRFSSREEIEEGDFRRYGPRFSDENFQRNLVLAERVRELAAEKGVTPAQLALAWVLSRGEHIVPIPGTKRRSYLEDNLAAAAVRLSPEESKRIAAAVPPATGDRYDAQGMTTVNR